MMLDGEKVPYDGCTRALHCAVQHVTCTACARFNDGRRWQEAPRTDASRERYARIFAE